MEEWVQTIGQCGGGRGIKTAIAQSDAEDVAKRKNSPTHLPGIVKATPKPAWLGGRTSCCFDLLESYWHPALVQPDHVAYTSGSQIF